MTSAEAMIYQLKKLKGKPLRQKIEHILTYFWLPIVGVLVLAIAAGSYIHHVATAKDTVLSVTCVNARADSADTEALVSEFAQKAGIDLNACDIQISANAILSDTGISGDYYTAQIVVAQISAQTIDMLVADVETATAYFYQDVFWDLRQLLTPQQQARYAQSFLYADMAVTRQLLEENIDTIQFPDPTKPEEMEEPVPVALLLNGSGDFAAKCYWHNPNGVAVCILETSENKENALAFLEFMMQ